MPKPLQETAAISERAAAEAKKSGRMLMQFISPGWGSSGYYSPDVLEAAAADRVIPAGTHMYADHPTDLEDQERPVRSVKDLMAVTTEDARVGDGGALVGEVQVVPQWRELVETVKDAIGVSIRGSATDIVEGEAEGRRGGIIEGLVAPVLSVDFVTRAGRGGRVLSVLESARAEHRAIAHGISEATVNDTREALQTVLRDTYGGDKTYVWVRDFDDSTVWFEVENADNAGLFAQAYSQADNGATALTGGRTEVRASTTYVPVTRPDSTTTTTEDDQEVTMAKIQIEESEHTRLLDEAGRVATLEAESATKDARIKELEEAEARRVRTQRASELIVESATKAQVEFTALERRGLLADLPLTEAGQLDEAAFTTTVDAAAVEAKKAPGAGVVGFGASATGGQAVDESAPAVSPWGRPLTTSSQEG